MGTLTTLARVASHLLPLLLINPRRRYLINQLSNTSYPRNDTPPRRRGWRASWKAGRLTPRRTGRRRNLCEEARTTPRKVEKVEDTAHGEINRSIYEGDVGRCNLNATQFSCTRVSIMGQLKFFRLGWLKLWKNFPRPDASLRGLKITLKNIRPA